MSLISQFGRASLRCFKFKECCGNIALRSFGRPSSSLSKLQSVQYIKSARTSLSGHNTYNIILQRYYFKGDQQQGSSQFSLVNRLAIVGGIGIILYMVFKDMDYIKELEAEKFRYEELNVTTPLGGDWELTDDEGKKRDSREFKGEWMLIYFGFSHCPDICPEEMQKMDKVIRNIDSKANIPNLQPIFISLDPERDTPKVIKDYLKDFNIPRIVGFTADSVDELKEVSKKFRVYFGKGETDEDNDYIIDHTIIMYLINCEGKFVNYYDRSLNATAITKSIEKHMELYKDLKKRMMI